MTDYVFGQWAALDEARRTAPAAPGVFQIKVASGLIDYPLGKSAMVHYEAAANLSDAISHFAASGDHTTHVCRYVETSPADAAALAERLLAMFARRFGSLPTLPVLLSSPG